MGSKDKIILDTNIIIYLLKGEQRLSDLLDGSQLAIEIRRRYGLHLADAVIAATSYFHNYQLVTADTDFLKVDGLYILKYEP